MLLDIGILDARPRFHQREGGGGQIFGDGNEHGFAVRGGDDAFVQKDILLERAFEVVAEGGVGVGGGQPAVIGLHEVALAHLVAFDIGADLDDADHRLMAGHSRFVAGHIVGHFPQRVLASMPAVMADLRAWPENCLSSLRSEKHKPTTSTRPRT